MEFRSIEQLQKTRKELLKELATPQPLNGPGGEKCTPFDDETWQMGVEALKRTIQDLDTEIRERTGMNSD